MSTSEKLLTLLRQSVSQLQKLLTTKPSQLNPEDIQMLG